MTVTAEHLPSAQPAGFFRTIAKQSSNCTDRYQSRCDGVPGPSRPAQSKCDTFAIYSIADQAIVERHLPVPPAFMGPARHLAAFRPRTSDTSGRALPMSSEWDIVGGASVTHGLSDSLSPLHPARYCFHVPRSVGSGICCCGRLDQLCNLHVDIEWLPADPGVRSASARNTGTCARVVVLYKRCSWRVSAGFANGLSIKPDGL